MTSPVNAAEIGPAIHTMVTAAAYSAALETFAAAGPAVAGAIDAELASQRRQGIAGIITASLRATTSASARYWLDRQIAADCHARCTAGPGRHPLYLAIQL